MREGGTSEDLLLAVPDDWRALLAALPVALLEAGRVRRFAGRGAPVDAAAQSAPTSIRATAEAVSAEPHLVIHAPMIARRLGLERLVALDLLELFAFVLPAHEPVPTTAGLAAALGLSGEEPARDDPPGRHRRIAGRLLALLEELPARRLKGAGALSRMLARAGWPWAPLVLSALSRRAADKQADAALLEHWRLWEDVPEWESAAPRPPPGAHAVDPDAAEAMLLQLRGPDSEDRPAQRAYARAAAAAFRPPEVEGAPNVVLAEAGTGTGKTLGYLAPALLWTQQNDGQVWISTFTRNLQRQVRDELARALARLPPSFRRPHVLVRKGRENYACLLNIADEAGRLASGTLARPRALLIALVLRWLAETRDGEIIGGDLPGWLASLAAPAGLAPLTDHRGECLYQGCAHYHRCFLERIARLTPRADIVITNHAFTITHFNTARDPRLWPRHMVFDEGHHLFHAADSAFAVVLSLREGAELRRWLLGRGRRRGLKERIGDLVAADGPASDRLAAVLKAAEILPAPEALRRIRHGAAASAFEAFLQRIQAVVLARAAPGARTEPYDLDSGCEEPPADLLEAARRLRRKLALLETAIAKLTSRLEELAAGLAEEGRRGEEAALGRLEAAAHGLSRRGEQLRAWMAMLEDLGAPPEGVIDRFVLRRQDHHVIDIGMARHLLDPGAAFAETVLVRLNGALITSATLNDERLGAGGAESDPSRWKSADLLTGAQHLPLPPRRFAVASPFNWADQAQVVVVRGLAHRRVDMLAGAVASLVEAGDGGALVLFTAIRRLVQVVQRLRDRLERRGLAVLAQHLDPIDPATLVTLMRSRPRTVLFGTDALRDGVDVPGDALSLVVFERVPWPRPDVLHRARRAAFGGRFYDEMITRFRIAQAFGRLIRTANDRGVFVLLDAGSPSRLFTALPKDVPIRRLELNEAASAVAAMRRAAPYG